MLNYANVKFTRRNGVEIFESLNEDLDRQLELRKEKKKADEFFLEKLILFFFGVAAAAMTKLFLP